MPEASRATHTSRAGTRPAAGSRSGTVASPPRPQASDAESPGRITRLEAGIERLLETQRALREQNDLLRSYARGRDERVRELEGLLRDANQRRQDAVKRIDELIGQIDQLSIKLGKSR